MTISLSTESASLDASTLRSGPLNVEKATTTTPVTSDADQAGANTSVYVDLSPLARGIASASEEAGTTQEAKNAKIEESGLPPDVQALLKRIAEYREKLKEKQQELQNVMQDQSLNEEQRQARINALQEAINSLNGALQEAMGQLSKLVAQMDLDDGAVIEMMSLTMS